jgi:hypothetical protein
MDGKADRYGVYSFIGRVMAFTYFHNGRRTAESIQRNYTASVASATVDFMDDNEELDWDEVRSRWIRMYDKTLDWYTSELAFVRPMSNRVPFHAFLATLQIATTDHLLLEVDAGNITEDQVKQVIKSDWREFAFNDPEINSQKPMGVAHPKQKQNSTHFWRAQRDWLEHLRVQLGLNESRSA